MHLIVFNIAKKNKTLGIFKKKHQYITACGSVLQNTGMLGICDSKYKIRVKNNVLTKKYKIRSCPSQQLMSAFRVQQ